MNWRGCTFGNLSTAHLGPQRQEPINVKVRHGKAVNVNLSICLIKHHCVKTSDYGGTAPGILNFSAGLDVHSPPSHLNLVLRSSRSEKNSILTELTLEDVAHMLSQTVGNKLQPTPCKVREERRSQLNGGGSLISPWLQEFRGNDRKTRQYAYKLSN